MEEIKQFLIEWNEWRKAGAPPSPVFSRSTGLCHNFDVWFDEKVKLGLLTARRRNNLYWELNNLFDGRAYPFCPGYEYRHRKLNKSQHLLPARIDWVEAMIEKLS